MTRERHKRRGGGFTLIEVLVVVGIIAVLAAILLPALNAAQDLAYESATRTRVMALDRACETFKQDHGAYPGLNRWPVGGAPQQSLLEHMNDGILSGSQVLAMCLMDFYVDTTADHSDGAETGWMPMSKYLEDNGDPRPAKYYMDPTGDIIDLPKPDEIELVDSDTLKRRYPVTGRDGIPRFGTLLDAWPVNKYRPRRFPVGYDKAMPILYFVARPGQAGVTRTYQATHNLGQGGTDAYDTAYPVADAGTLREFYTKIMRSGDDPTDSTSVPYKRDSFILIAPGKDREWFTGDDITNFSE
ncbi:MAG: type II secretion system protein [Planctomycetota bacterium]